MIGFDRDRQRDLLKRLGMERADALTLVGWMLLAIAVIGTLAAALWWWLAQRAQAPRDPIVREWHRLRERLRRAGLPIAPHETVRTVLERAAQRWPEHAPRFRAFAEGYYRARFSPAGGPVDTAALARALAHERRQLPGARRLRAALPATGTAPTPT